ncbi:MAG: GHKL domain-containing protein [Limnoraphis sp. WC205]|jgi:signal transduction histidine kinase|nr:GHKL domain-containing protein [Limnoraphis sp. WC205]
MDNEIETVTIQYNILDFVAVGLCLLRSDWIVLFWNRYLEQYTQIPKQQIVGTPLFAHFHQLNPQKFHSYGYQVFQQGGSVHFSVRLNEWKSSACHSTEASPLGQVSLTSVSAIAGEGFYGLLTLQNCIPTVSRLSYSSAKSDDQQLELEQLMDRIAHDLREPLRMVVNFSQLLRQRYGGKLDSSADQMIHFMVDASRRMQQMIDGLLVYFRLKIRHQPPQLIDAHIALQEAINHLQLEIVQTQTQIKTTALPKVIADSPQLTQLFTILIENAIKYCRDRPPKIEIAVQLKAEVWVFSVQDNGIGIDTKDYACIFEIFQRLHSQRDYPGIGMGLAIAKRIVELHQGCIWVDSQTQQGSTFYFTIPCSVQINPLLTSSENP